MSLTKWFINRGVVIKQNQVPYGAKEDNAFDLLKWLRQSLLSYLNVPYWDNCCDSTKTTFPVRYNSVTQKLEYFDGTTWTKPPATSIT